jgi:hypothetical protein
MGARGLIDAVYHPVSQELMLAAYNDEGALLLSSVTPTAVSLPLPLPGGHTSVIRSVEFVTPDLVLTGGEDGKVCVWGRGVAPVKREAHSRPGATSGHTRHKPHASPF